MSDPLVSVIVPTYNRGATIARAVRSALEQDYESLDVVVVDDCSTDVSAAVLAELAAADGRVRVVRHERNRGASAARNTGVAAARGEYVAFLDSDDYWRPGKTRRQMQFMRDHGFAISCTSFSSVYEEGGTPIRKRRPYDQALTVEDVVWGVYVAPGTTLLAERRVLEAIGGYDSSLGRLEDWDLLLKAVLEVSRLGFLDEDFAVIHPSSGCSMSVLERSAESLVGRGLQMLEHYPPRLSRQFRAGVAFELAAAHWKWGSRWRAMSSLAKTFALAPVSNQSVRVILLPWLRDVLSGAR